MTSEYLFTSLFLFCCSFLCLCSWMYSCFRIYNFDKIYSNYFFFPVLFLITSEALSSTSSSWTLILWMLLLIKLINRSISPFTSCFPSAVFLASFKIFASISYDVTLPVIKVVNCFNFSFSTFYLGILFLLVCSHFEIYRPPGGCLFESSSIAKVTTCYEVCCNFNNNFVLWLFMEYYLLPSTTPIICANKYGGFVLVF